MLFSSLQELLSCYASELPPSPPLCYHVCEFWGLPLRTYLLVSHIAHKAPDGNRRLRCLVRFGLSCHPWSSYRCASTVHTGGCLSFGPTWETARPVAFDSMQLTPAQTHYPTHEQELLTIVHTLHCWHFELLGTSFTIRLDHHTLEHFLQQTDLSRRQACWSEFLSQYNFNIEYLPGADNTVANALSCLPVNVTEPIVDADPADDVITSPLCLTIAPILNLHADAVHLDQIRTGYETDPFCTCLRRNLQSIPGATLHNGLLYVTNRLVIPRVPGIREVLFRLAHDTLSHFGVDKTYLRLCDSYYWPGMKRDVEQGYVPSCSDCQRNKSSTHKPMGPLHPLLVPDKCGDSVAIDFIGPLPEDDGYNCIVTMTDTSGADIRLTATQTDISAEDFTHIFFDQWYCNNGLPLHIISDRDKLFVSHFWRALHSLTGIHLKMSSAFHPQTDSASEQTNKTINQCLRYHVDHTQSGWAHALPHVQFNIMNTVNTSTGYSNFQLLYGRSPRILPPLVPSSAQTADETFPIAGERATALL